MQAFTATLKQSLQFPSKVVQHAFLAMFTNLPDAQAVHLLLSVASQSVQPSIILQQRGGLAEFKK